MIKVYEAKSHVGVSVKLPNGKYRRISFISSSYGSYFQTEDKNLQEALEAHPWYGSVFKCVASPVDKDNLKTGLVPHTIKEEYDVESFIEAKDILQGKGIEITSIRSKNAIEEVAAKNCIKFNWIK